MGKGMRNISNNSKSKKLFIKHPNTVNNIYITKEKNPMEYILLSSAFLLKWS